jgi:hypothetical protein
MNDQIRMYDSRDSWNFTRLLKILSNPAKAFKKKPKYLQSSSSFVSFFQ